MRPGLLRADRDLDLEALPVADPTLAADLGLDRLFEAMAGGDRIIDDVVRRVVVAPLGSVEAIRYRQASVTDALATARSCASSTRSATEAIDAERKVWGGQMRNAELVLDRAAEVIGLFLASFRSMRGIEAAHASRFTSPGFVGVLRARPDPARRCVAQPRPTTTSDDCEPGRSTSARAWDPAIAARATSSIDARTSSARGVADWVSRSGGPRSRSCSATRTR